MAFALSNAGASACAGDGTHKGLLELIVSGKVQLYDGTRAATPDTAVGAQNPYLSVTLALPSPAGTVSNGVISMGAITNGTCNRTGTPTWARLFESDGTTVVGDCDVSCTGSGSDMNLAATLVSGDTVALSSFTITIPAH